MVGGQPGRVDLDGDLAGAAAQQGHSENVRNFRDGVAELPRDLP